MMEHTCVEAKAAENTVPLSIEDVFSAFHDHLQKCRDQLRCFGKYEYQCEGWLKAEFITLLEDLKQHGKIEGLDREHRVQLLPGRSKMIDLVLILK
jgi:hypothetical protein